MVYTCLMIYVSDYYNTGSNFSSSTYFLDWKKCIIICCCCRYAYGAGACLICCCFTESRLIEWYRENNRIIWCTQSSTINFCIFSITGNIIIVLNGYYYNIVIVPMKNEPSFIWPCTRYIPEFVKDSFTLRILILCTIYLSK